MKGILKQSATFLGYHAIYSVLSLVFMLPFSSLIYYNDGVTRPIGGIFYTFVILLLYLPCIYSNMWKLGKNHTKKISEVKPDVTIPLKISIISEIPTFIIFVLMVIFHLKNPDGFNLFYTIYKVWQAIYIGIIDIAKPLYVIILFVPVIFAYLGYVAGCKNFEIAEKYIYPLMFKKKKS